MNTRRPYLKLALSLVLVVGMLLMAPDVLAQAVPPTYDRSKIDVPVRKYAPTAPAPRNTIQANLLTNGGFESGLTGWTVVSGGSGSWFSQTGIFSPFSGFPVPPPPEGAFAAMSDQFGPGMRILYQDVTLAGPAELSFELYVGNRAGVWFVGPNLDHTGPPNQHLRVDIMDPSAPVDDTGAGVLLNVFLTDPGDPSEFGYISVTADLTPFAGQTVRVRFASVDNLFFMQTGVDDVVVELIGVPDLVLTKTCEADDDGTGTFNLRLKNDGEAAATGVEVQDTMPGGITVTGTNTVGPGTFSAGTGLWSIGELLVGAAATLEIDFTFDPGVPGQYINRAEVVALNEIVTGFTPGDGMGDDYDECGFIVFSDRGVADFVPARSPGGITERGDRFEADVEVSKTVDVETAPVGGMVHYKVKTTNNGPFSTSKVQITDNLPACLVDASWETSRGDYDGSLWDLGSLKVGETDSLEVWATVGETCDGTVTNEAWVSRSSLPDPENSPLTPDAPLEDPFTVPRTKRNNHAKASFDVETSGRVLDGTTFALGNNYPNPFNPTTMVPFSLAEAAHVSIKVYDLLGREVAVLVDGAMSAGRHEVTFEASTLPTGVYLIRMEAAGIVQVQRVTLMK